MKRLSNQTWMLPIIAMLPLLIVGCGPRAAVVQESIVAQIDKAIGEFQVRRKEIEINITKLEGSLKKLREGAITSKTRGTQLDRDITAAEESIAKCESALGELRNHLASEAEPVVMAGKEYTLAQVKEMAGKVITAHKTATTKRDGLKRAQDILAANATKLEQKMNKGKEQISAMKAQLDEIDAKLLAVNSIREAAQISGADDNTLAEDFDKVQDQINSLFGKVEVASAIEFDDATAAETSIDDILKETGATGASVDDIDKILSGK